MHDDSRVVPEGFGDIDCSVFLRPFAKGTILAYELVLHRTSGGRVYDRSLSFLNGADAHDLVRACPDISFVEAR